MDDSDHARVEITIDPSGGEYRVKIHRCHIGQLITVLESILTTLRNQNGLPLGGGADQQGDGTLH